MEWSVATNIASSSVVGCHLPPKKTNCRYGRNSAIGFRFSRKQTFFYYMRAESDYMTTVDASYLTLGFSMETAANTLTQQTFSRVPMSI